MNRVTRLWMVVGIIAGTLGVDRLAKNLAIDHLAEKPPREFLGGAIRFLYEENPGAMLGLGSGLHETSRFWVFTVLVGIVLVGLLLYLLFRKSVTSCDVVAFSMIVGGGVGNLIDRILYDGVVVDFVNIGIGAVRTGVFNVADTAVIAGVALYLICQLRLELRSRRGRSGSGPPPAESGA